MLIIGAGTTSGHLHCDLTSPCALPHRPFPELNTHRVAPHPSRIAGAGLAGLAAGKRLAAASVPFILLEVC